MKIKIMIIELYKKDKFCLSYNYNSDIFTFEQFLFFFNLFTKYDKIIVYEERG